MPVDISIVIPARNAATDLPAQLDALAAQETTATFEVVVGNNASTDATESVALGYSNRLIIRVVDASRAPGINVARNEAIAAAAADVILLCDADDTVRPGWIQAHWLRFQAGADLTGGAMDRHVGTRSTGVSTALANSLDFLPWATGANCGFRKAIWAELGPLDESYRGGGDETAFFWKAQLAGHTLEFVSDAVVQYQLRTDLKGLWRQQVNYGKSHAKLLREFRSSGMQPRPAARVARETHHLVRQCIRAVIHTSRRRDAVTAAGLYAGRVIGSVKYRTRY
jgi:glycosyltransferase involved in cell wall biosynthesis